MLTNNFFFFRMPLKQQQTFFGNITKISQEKTWRRACMESGFGFEFWICHSAKCLQINIFFLIYLKEQYVAQEKFSRWDIEDYCL